MTQPSACDIGELEGRKPTPRLPVANGGNWEVNLSRIAF